MALFYLCLVKLFSFKLAIYLLPTPVLIETIQDAVATANTLLKTV